MALDIADSGCDFPRMKARKQSWVVLGTVLILGLGGIGCEKKREAEHQSAVTEATAQLPGSAEVFGPLEKKDYEGSIKALMQLKNSIQTPEQQTHYVTISDELKIRLLDEAPNDPKAAEALAALRAMTGGR